MIIHNNEQKSNNNVISKILISLSFAFVGIGSFGLGHLWKIEQLRLPVSIDYQNFLPLQQSMSSTTADTRTIRKYVGSKHGKIYYLATCKAVKRIKDENKVWFETSKDAELAGFRISTSCKEMML